MNRECKLCNIKIEDWNDIFIIYEDNVYCVECYENYTGKQIKLNCLN